MRPVSGFTQAGTDEVNRGVEIQPQIAEGRPISRVYIHLVKSTGDPAGDEALKRQVAEAFGIRQGAPFRQFIAGLICDLPGKNSSVDVSIGKQVYQLRDGFLLSKIPVSTSIGKRAALYLGPRLTSENTALVRAKAFGFGLNAFLIEPSEIDEIATNTQLAGVNLPHSGSILIIPIDADLKYFL